MGLEKQDIEFIKANIGEWLVEKSLGRPPAVYEIELRERMVRVEEELKTQRELMRMGFEHMESRFEAMQASMDKRFEQIEKRFELVDKRFQQVDERFERVLNRLDRFMLWSFGTSVAMAGMIIGAMRFML